VLCSALSMVTAACSHDLSGSSSKTALDCLHRDREACALATTIEPAKGGAATTRASQIELDVEAILDGMQEPHRGSQIPALRIRSNQLP
jgi:hypothetical protein